MGATIASLWGFALLVSDRLHDSLKELLEAQQYSTVSYVAEDIDSALQLRMRSLNEVASRFPSEILPDAGRISSFLEERRAIYNLFDGGLIVVKPDGSGAWADWPPVSGRQERRYDAFPFLAELRETGRIAIDRPAMEPALGRAVLRMAAPIQDRDGRRLAILVGVASINAPYFLDIVSRQPLGRTGHFLVAAPRHGVYVTGTDASVILKPFPPPAANALRDQAVAGFEGTAVTVGSDGIEYLMAIRQVPTAGWFVVARLPTAEAFAPIRQMRALVFGGAGLVSLLIGIGVAITVGRALAPLARVTAAFDAISQGQAPLRPLEVPREAEVGRLVSSFNRLQERLNAESFALGQSEALLVQAQRLARIGHYVFDLTTDRWTSSQTLDDIFGVTSAHPRDLAGWLALVHPADRPAMTAYINEHVIAEANPFDRAYRIVRPRDGATRWVHGLGQIALDEDGRVTGMFGIIQDITERKEAEVRIDNERVRLRTLLATIPDPVWLKSPDGAILACNAAFETLCGAREAELVDGHTPNIAKDEPALTREGSSVREETVIHPVNGRGAVLEIISTPMLDGDQRRIGILGIARDVTERKLAEERQRLAASVFTSTHEGIVITDADAVIIDVNEAFSRITGYRRHEVLGRKPSLLQSGRHDETFYAGLWRSLIHSGHWSGEVWNRRRDGRVYAELLTISAVQGDDRAASHYVGVFADITAQKEHERELERIAHFDPLTGIPNRLLLADRMERALTRTRRAETSLAIACMDLDGFKPINDTFGHEVGDQFLVKIAHRLRDYVRGGDTVARVGGDEFILLLALDRIEECDQALKRILKVIAHPVTLAGHTLRVSASLGVTLFPQDNSDADALIRHADQAMYQAKAQGRNRYHLFVPDAPPAGKLGHAHVEAGVAPEDASA